MPRGQKSKHRAREKRRQARAETQGLHDQTTTSGGEETTSSSPPDSESGPSSSSAAGTSKGPQGAQGTTSAAAGAIRKRSGVGRAARSRSGVGAEGQVQEGENSSQASAAAGSSHTDLLTWKAEVLVQYMLCKYTMRALIKRSEMLKAVTRRYREQFPEILSRASERMELVFGLVLKEVRPNSHCYTLVSNLDLSDSESMRGDWGLPKNGLLMPLLGVIYLNGNHAPEEKIWKFLNMLGIYDGRSHFIFGEPRKLITEDLVREGYLEYRQVPGSDPPRYEFLWGPKLLTETSKMKVLQFLAKVKDSGHTAFLPQYEEAWREEVESTGDRGAARAGPSASLRPGTAASAAAGPSSSSWPGSAASASAGPSASLRPGTAASASAGPAASTKPGIAASASAGPSASTKPDIAASATPLLALLLRPRLALHPQPLLALLLQPGLALHPQLLLGLRL
ncbi:melanoma-associated antigen B2-like [Capricornis sumatraensis]|uniref:melanoma-associated antigen B2-like n=1 Tax=Capricornis sumatraensis TaxID=34865 RepID=UPI0036049318